MGRKKSLPLLEQVLITDVAAEGKAIARVNDLVLFVPHCVPGDIVDVQVIKKKKSFMEGVVRRLVKPSDLRVEPFCSHFGECGGCKWQPLPYAEQLKFKQKQVEDQLIRIGKLSIPVVNPILGSAKTEWYRNKLEFTFSNKRWMSLEEIQSGLAIENPDAVGFHIPGMFDKVLDIQKCYLQDEPSNEIRNAVRAYALEHGLSFFDLRQQEGFLRTLMIRTATTGDVMVVMVFAYEDEQLRVGLMEHLKQSFPQITSLLYVINEKRNDTITDQEVICYAGKEYIVEKMEDLEFMVGPKSFYQTNSEQAYQLYSVVRNLANIQGHEIVYDLYTGTGTIANFIARQAKLVVGIEYVSEAIEDAQRNAQKNAITNTRFFAGDMKDVLNQEFIAQHGHPDVIIVDPPRAGMHPDVVETILLAHPDRIVYVSCNPATQARDLSLMQEAYHILAVQPVDMFPHTHHVENVVLLTRRQKADEV